MRNVRKQLKKDYPGLNKKGVDLAITFHDINFGPHHSKAIAKGYALVDDSFK